MAECERRGCDEGCTHQITIEAPKVSQNETIQFDVCDGHVGVAVEEFQAYGCNILAGMEVA